MSDNNPFFTRQPTLPYQAPRFDVIDDSHYRPAFDEGVRRQRAEIRGDYRQPARRPDFDNTLVALEQSGQLLGRVSRRVLRHGRRRHTNPLIFRRWTSSSPPSWPGLANDIWLNDTLFARVEAVWQDREALDAESRRLTEEMYQHFVLAGARLNADEKAELKALNTEAAAADQASSQQRLLAAVEVRRAGGGRCYTSLTGSAADGGGRRGSTPRADKGLHGPLAAGAVEYHAAAGAGRRLPIARDPAQVCSAAGWDTSLRRATPTTRASWSVRLGAKSRARQAQLLGFDQLRELEHGRSDGENAV